MSEWMDDGWMKDEWVKDMEREERLEFAERENGKMTGG